MLQKLKELSKDTAVYGVSTIVGRFLNFLLTPFYTNVFTRAEFGEYANIYAYVAFFNIVFIYGMDAAYLKYASVSEGEKKKDAFSTPLIFITFTSIILSSLIAILHQPISGGIYVDPQYAYLLLFVAGILLLDTVALIPFSYLRLQRKTVKFAVIKLLNIIINISMNIILILGFDYGIEAIFISNLAASAFSLIALIPDIIKNFRFNIDKALLKRMLKFALPYLPASLSAMIVQVIDRPILKAITDADVVGVYQANYRLGIFMMLFVQMFQYAWQPFFLNNAGEQNAKQIFSKVLTLFVIVGSFIWVLISLFVGDLAAIEVFEGVTIIGKEFLSGIYIVPLILLGYLFHGLYINFMAGMYIEEKTKYFPLITGIGAASNVIVNFALIPVIGMTGAAIATPVSYFLIAATLYFTVQRFYPIQYELWRIGKIFIAIFIIMGLYYYLFSIGELLLIYKFGLLFFFIAYLFIFGVLDKDELVRTAKQLFANK
jgi:O-antigen/teichoic acid export membrane protein